MKRPLHLSTWLAAVVLMLGVTISSLLAPVYSIYADSEPLNLKIMTEKIVVGEKFELEVTAQTPIGKEYSLDIPEKLTLDELQLKQVAKQHFKEVHFDEKARQLKFEIKESEQSHQFKLGLIAEKNQQFEMRARAKIPVPKAEPQPNPEEQSTSEHAATDLPVDYQDYQTEPLTITVDQPKETESTYNSKEQQSDSPSKNNSAQEVSDNESKAPEQAKSSGENESESNNDADQSKKVEKQSSNDSKASQAIEKSTATSKVSSTDKTEKVASVEKKTTTTSKAKSAALAANTTVSNYDQFKAAYNDGNVTEITLADDITAPGNPVSTDLAIRTTGVIINGNNKSLDIGRAVFRIGATSSIQTIRIQNFKSIRASATTGTGGTGGFGMVQNGGDATGTAGSKWIVQFADLTTHEDVLRLASVAGNQIEISGTVNATTVWETAVTSSVKVADNATLTARKSRTRGEDRSFFWFPTSPISGGTGDKKFIIGDGATVDCQGAETDLTYPVVYLNYEELTVGTGATYIAKMYGFVYNAQQGTNNFTAKENSKITMENMRENGPQSAINFAPSLLGSANFTVKPGSEFYATNRSRAPVFGGVLASVRILLDSPKKYDIQNTSTGLTTALASVVNLTIGSFRITNTNLSMWSVSLPVTVNAKATYQNVAWIEQNLAVVTSSNGSLLTALFSFSISRRINNTLSIPTAEYSSPYDADLGKPLVTDADKKVRLRVIVGYNEAGETAVPIYATAGAATVELTDDQGVKRTATTETGGYVNFNLNRFLVAGKQLKAAVTTSFTADPVTITVQDKTPPTPVKVKNDRIVADQTQLTGQNADAGQVRYTVNGAPAVDGQNNEISDTVAGDGTWKMQRATPAWRVGDQVQLLIKDAAGNENPTTETQYHDATFAAATKYTVAPANGPTPPTQPDNPGSGPATETENSGTGNTGELRLDYAPSNFNFGEAVTSWRDKTYAAKPISGVSKQWLQVSDNRLNQHGWSVKARQSQAFMSSSGKVLTGATVQLPAGQTYNQNTASGLNSHAISITASDQTVFGANGQSTAGKDLSTNVWNPTAVQLLVPGGTAVNGQTYSGTVSWTLTSEVDS